MKLVSFIKKNCCDEKSKSRVIRRRKNVKTNNIGIQVVPSQINAAMEQLTQRQNIFKENANIRIKMKFTKFPNLFVSGGYEEIPESPSSVSMFEYGKFEKII